MSEQRVIGMSHWHLNSSWLSAGSAAEVQLTPVSTAVAQVAAAQAAAGAIGGPAPALVDVPGRGRTLSLTEAVPAAAQLKASAEGAPAPTLVDIPGQGRSLSPSDAVPEPFLYRNLEEVANKLGAASCPGNSPIPPCTRECQELLAGRFCTPLM